MTLSIRFNKKGTKVVTIEPSIVIGPEEDYWHIAIGFYFLMQRKCLGIGLGIISVTYNWNSPTINPDFLEEMLGREVPINKRIITRGENNGR